MACGVAHSFYPAIENVGALKRILRRQLAFAKCGPFVPEALRIIIVAGEPGPLHQVPDHHRGFPCDPSHGVPSKLPLAKDIDDFVFDDTPVNETLVRDLAGGNFLAHQRNVVLIGGTGTGKTHLAIAIARSAIRGGARGRFFNVVDLVNKLEAEARSGRQGPQRKQ